MISVQENGWQELTPPTLQAITRNLVFLDEKRRAENVQAGNTTDSFQNFQLSLGIGTDNATTYSTYGFNPITRNRTLLEWMHRGSWLAGVVIDSVADDMTKAGIQISSPMPPQDIQQLESAAIQLEIWPKLGEVKKWGRLYGGAAAVLMIDGQDLSTPFRLETVGRGQFKGVLPLDRWMLNPSLEERVSEMGPRLGEPKYYQVLAMAPALWGQTIHYSRLIRAEGIKLPYWQRIMENLWSISVLERLYDRMVGFDMATSGTIQLAYRAYLRVLKQKGFRQMVAGPPQLMQSAQHYLEWMRRWQGVEGITVIDAEDEFEAHQPGSYSGLAEVLMQLGQQVAGAAEAPLVRLFGMSPTGFTTGETDLRIYYGGINQKQENELRLPIDTIYRALAQSEGISLSDDFSFIFKSLWQLRENEKAEVAERAVNAIDKAKSGGIISNKTALMELRQNSRETGFFSNITDEEIDNADELPPDPADLFGTNAGGPGNAMPGEGAGGGHGEGEQGEEREDRPDRRQGAGAGGAAGRLQVLRGGRDSASYTTLIPGLDVMIETPSGAHRPPWQRPLPADYGHIRNTDGADGEEIDCFVGPEQSSDKVWIIDQLWPDSGEFDEHKVFLGYPSRVLAIRDYQKCFDDGLGAARIGGVREMTLRQFKDWLARGEHKTRAAA